MVEIGGEVTEKDYLEAQALHAQAFLLRAVLLMILLVLALTLVFVLAEGVHRAGELIVAGLIALVVALPLAFGLRRLLLVRTYRGQPSLQGQHGMRFTEDRIEASSPGVEGELEWSVFTGWKEGERVFLLYQAGNLFNMIPKHWFAGDEQSIEAFRSLLRERLGDS